MEKDFDSMTLCAEKDGSGTKVFVNATVDNGELNISGQDIGNGAQDFWGDEDYEYWYKLDKKDTEKFHELLGKNISLQEALVQNFSGLEGCIRFRVFCEENGIKYQFFNY